jgi:hypothetical protein
MSDTLLAVAVELPSGTQTQDEKSIGWTLVHLNCIAAVLTAIY